MAPKRPSAVENAPSESEEIPVTQNTDSDSEEDMEPTEKPFVQKSDEEEADGMSENYDTDPSDSAVRPIVSNPKMVESSKPKKPSAPKQTSEVAQNKGKPDGALEQKKPPIVRLWTDEGELAALKAMNEYRSKKGLDPYSDTGLFFEFAKNSIPVEVTRNQLVDKLRRLRKKFESNSLKGDDPAFSKAHDKKAFDLSKKIWGGGVESVAKSSKRKVKSDDGGVEGSVEKEGEKSNKKAKKVRPLEELVKDDRNEKGKKVAVSESDGLGFWDKYPRLKEALEMENSQTFHKDGKRAMEIDMSKMGDAKAKELEDKWKGYLAKEAELKLLKLELVSEQTKVVFNVLRKR